jgi:anaerobic nitric oxide reductase transcription regulator
MKVLSKALPSKHPSFIFRKCCAMRKPCENIVILGLGVVPLTTQESCIIDNNVVCLITMTQLETIVAIASDLTAALSAQQRYRRLLEALQRVIPFDAAALHRLDNDVLVPVASVGLSDDAMGRRFPIKDHPRLQIISRSREPVVFPSDCALPDPFDGLLACDQGSFMRVHACLGCPLWVGDSLIGVFTADAAEPRKFDAIDQAFLKAVGALAAVEMHTTHLIEALEQSANRHGLVAKDLMREVQLRHGTEIIGESPAMVRLRRDIDLVARTDYTVLILGETGTGKELVARAVHAASARSAKPMLYVNCAALPENLVESELFGHVKGAFTGASVDRAGKFEVANGGTLFLDEIGDLPLSVQPKLLRAIQYGEIQRVGSDKVIRADVRLIAATNRDLEQEVREGRFRADLFHRLNVYPLRVPPLRERVEDIPLLAGYFCHLARRRLGLGPVRLAPETIPALKRYGWPGNVRELENVISRATLKASASASRSEPVVITVHHLGAEFEIHTEEAQGGPITSQGDAPVNINLREATRAYQRALIRRALEQSGGNWAKAALALGMHRSNLHHLAVRLGLK